MKLNLKKIVSVGVTAAAVVLLAACGNSNKKSEGFRSELAQNDTLTIGLEGTYAPYSYRKDGKLTGFEVELGKKIADKLNLNPDVVPTKWDSLIAGAGSGKFDVVINNITPTPQRKQSYIFSTPYLFTRYALISRTGTKFSNLSDVKGKKLAEGTGTDNANVAKKAGATVIPQGEFATTLQMIRQKQVDASINATTSWYAYKKNNATDGLQMKTIPDSEQAPAKAAVLINKKNKGLQKQVNSALASLRKDGTLKKLSIKYFGADITK